MIRGAVLWLLSTLILHPPFVQAQVSVWISATGPRRDLARDVTFTNGPGGLGNLYLFNPSYAYENVTVYFTIASPGEGGGNSISLAILKSGDQNVINPCSAICLNSFEAVPGGMAALSCCGALNYGTVSASFNVQGVSGIEIIPTLVSGSALSTVSLYIVESQLQAANYCAVPPCGSGAGMSVYPGIPFIAAQGSSGAESFGAGVVSMVFGIPSGSVGAATGNFVLTLQVQSAPGSGPLLLAKAIIERTLPSSSTIIDSVPITWGGTSIASLPVGLNPSDKIAYIADAAHDYYIILVTQAGNTGFNVYSEAAGILVNRGGVVDGDASGDTIPTLQGILEQDFWYGIVTIVAA
jgi:hypothetical protein